VPKPDFDYEAGHWAEPDYVVGAGRGQSVPKELTCSGPGSSFVIYACEAEWVNRNPNLDGCAGFSIVEEPAKSVWDKADRAAMRVAQRIKCPAACPDHIPDHIWHAASCSRVNPPGWDLVTVAVEFRVECRKFGN